MLEDETDASFTDRLTGDVFVTEEDSPGVGKFEAGDAAQQRGLAGAGRPEQRDQLARCDVEINAAERSEATECILDAANLDVHDVGLDRKSTRMNSSH